MVAHKRSRRAPHDGQGYPRRIGCITPSNHQGTSSKGQQHPVLAEYRKRLRATSNSNSVVIAIADLTVRYTGQRSANMPWTHVNRFPVLSRGLQLKSHMNAADHQNAIFSLDLAHRDALQGDLLIYRFDAPPARPRKRGDPSNHSRGDDYRSRDRHDHFDAVAVALSARVLREGPDLKAISLVAAVSVIANMIVGEGEPPGGINDCLRFVRSSEGLSTERNRG